MSKAVHTPRPVESIGVAERKWNEKCITEVLTPEKPWNHDWNYHIEESAKDLVVSAIKKIGRLLGRTF